LTNSIENSVSGDVFDTEIHRIFPGANKTITRSHWQFNWAEQIKISDREVYKLVIKGNQTVIQGLISIGDQGDHIYMHLIESARFN
jgi:hypothetical protein